ncbi:hypothetical protein DNTS_013667 [Danionella cerebrum]|uniref:Adenylate cyclase N-terminal domain-containing protein n=1 Tax=Danionella cerebrum TaxID=2873325 RepID=A0A553N4K0_9TELE|nr:hypothetical protein DNTS_013667 [Danionella translucida]
MRDPAAALRCSCGMRRGESRRCVVDGGRRERERRGGGRRLRALELSPTCGWWRRVLRIRSRRAWLSRRDTTSAGDAKSSGWMNGPAMEEATFPRVRTRRRKSRCLVSACEREFDCKELETLFQKYNLKLEQTSTLKALAILILAASALALVELLSAGSRFTVSKGSHPVHCVIFTSLFIVTNVKYLQVTQLQQIARLALLFSFTFALLCCPFPLALGHGTQGALGPDAPSAAPEQGVWQLMLVTFVAYSLLPVRTLLAVLFGVLVAASHFIVTATSVTTRRPLVWAPVMRALVARALHMPTGGTESAQGQVAFSTSEDHHLLNHSAFH